MFSIAPSTNLVWSGVNHTEGVMLDENGNIVQKGENGPYIQSERLDIYKKYIQELLDNGKAYYCFCTKERLDEVREKQKEAGETPRYDGHCIYFLYISNLSDCIYGPYSPF